MSSKLYFRSIFAFSLSVSSLGAVHAANTTVSSDTDASNNLTEVVVTSRVLRHDEEFKTDQTTKVLDQDQIKESSIVGGVAKALGVVPGVSTSSYGSTGSAKTTISVDGIKIGWAGFSGGNPDNGSLGVTFDGVPMANPGNGLWQASLIPQTSVLQTIGVTYGPGDPSDRWFTNIGGAIAFTPLQPTETAGGEVALTYGSFQTENVTANYQFGKHDGWSTVVALGANHANSYQEAPDGFGSQSHNYAVYLKTRKDLDGGSYSIGYYMARSHAYRPLATPVSPIPGVSINGYNQPGPLFSQQTTGFYETLPKSVDYKLDTNNIAMLYGDLDLALSDTTKINNLTYVIDEFREHWTPLHDYVPGSESLYELNQPNSKVFGDKLAFDFKLPYNEVTVGGLLQVSQYHSREQLYNPSLGFIKSPVPVPANLTGSAWAPNGNYFSDIFHQVNTALFIEDKISLVPTLSITPGLRAFIYQTDFSHDEASQFPLAVLYNPGGNLSQFPDTSKTFHGVEPSIGMNWQAEEWLALYASFARAYRQPENGGGTGPYVAIAASNVQLEHGNHYQGGVKLRFPDLGIAKDISANASYYHLDFLNETIPTALASGGSLLAYGSSKYDGVNFFADGSPYTNVYLFANVGTVHAKFSSFTNGSGTFGGVPVPYTPNVNGNVGAYYVGHVDDVRIQPRISYQYTGAQHIYDNSLNITSTQKLPSFGIVNFSTEATLPTAGKMGPLHDLKLAVEVDNLFGKQYNAFEYVSAGGLYGAGGYTNPTTVGAGSVLALPAPPRAFYVTVSASF